jgi:beta-galactosidase/beta-glucuronidase
MMDLTALLKGRILPLSFKKGQPNPQAYRANYTLLNGAWDFIFDDEKKGRQSHYETTFPNEHRSILVPFPYQSEKSGINEPTHQCDVVYYHKNITIAHLDCINRLTFVGSDYRTSVYLNGALIGEHIGGYDAFSFDLTPFAKKGVNELVVRCEDKMHIDQLRGKQRWRKENYTCYYTETTGLVRSVYLEELPKEHIESFTFKADAKALTLTGNVVLALEKTKTFRVKILDREGNLVKEGTFTGINGNNPFALSLAKAHPYSHSDPYLYNLVFTLEESKNVIDQVLSYAGFVSYHAEKGHVYVNDEDTYLKFVLDQGYYHDTLSSPTIDEMAGDLSYLLEAGFNGLRKHEKIEEPIYYFLLDVLGLYVWQEIPSAQEYSLESRKQYLSQGPRLVEEFTNHPCIMAYVLFNESWGINDIHVSKEMQDFTLQMYDLFKPLAHDRFVISNDGWEHTKSDLLTFHNYAETFNDLEQIYGPGLKAIERGENAFTMPNWKKFYVGDFHYQGEPIIFSEFAGIAFNKDTQDGWGYGDGVKDEASYLAKYSEQLRWIASKPEIRGFCATQLSDVEQEKNGFLSFDRHVKISADALAKLHARFH